MLQIVREGHPRGARIIHPAVWALIALVLLGGTAPVAAEAVRVGHVEAELVAENAQVVAGQPLTVGLRLQMDEAWHVYWRNPGDAGLPPKLIWDLPEGFAAGEVQWPYPDKFPVPPLMSYGYHGEVLLPVTIMAPTDLTPGESVTLRARTEWLVCKEECVPGKADLTLTLPVGNGSAPVNEQWAPLFAAARERLPLIGGDWRVSGSVDGSSVVIDLAAPAWLIDTLEEVTYLPFEQQVIENAAVQQFTRLADGYRLVVERSHYSQKIPDAVRGILVSPTGWRGQGSEKALEFTVAVETAPITAVGSTGTTAAGGLLRAILFAFLGGMILNLMPCVLPVLSLKILGFVQQANKSRRQVLGHGLVFAAGVLASFWALAGVLALLQSGGAQLGWGFQLQSPVFVVVLASFMFLFGLNLLGVFEIGTSLMAAGGRRRSGLSGSFVNGITATLVATPCTAPFMGSALGFSLTQPGWVAWVVFTALGLGMAAPYVVLSASPGLLKFVPKPGRWMETLKQVMGFFLFGTVVWLVWVLGQQAGINAVGVFLMGLLALATGAWIYGRWGNPASDPVIRRVAQVTAVLLLSIGLGAGLFGAKTIAAAPDVSAGSSGTIAWEPFSRERVADFRKSGKIVFIDFTAAWCLSCQVNERVAFGSAEVQEKFAELGIVAIKADWTNRNEEITRALAEFGRNSVPLYVLYGPDSEPVILPEILTPGIVLNALEHIDN